MNLKIFLLLLTGIGMGYYNNFGIGIFLNVLGLLLGGLDVFKNRS